MTTLKLVFLDWLLTRETKAFELWNAVFAFFVGISFCVGDSALLALSKDQGQAFFFNIPMLGQVLLMGSLVQVVGFLSNYFHYAKGRKLRWIGSCIEGGVWGTCLLFSIFFLKEVAELRWVYMLLFTQETWVVMAITYRGSRGKATV